MQVPEWKNCLVRVETRTKRAERKAQEKEIIRRTERGVLLSHLADILLRSTSELVEVRRRIYRRLMPHASTLLSSVLKLTPSCSAARRRFQWTCCSVSSM